MFKEEYLAVADAAAGKVTFLKEQPIRYFVLAALAGIYIGFGTLLAYTAGGMMGGNPAAQVIMGCIFGVSLSLVFIAGAELFTANNLVMTAGLMHRKVQLKDAAWLWAVCWAGNLIGSVLLAGIYTLTGLSDGQVAEFMASAALTKMSAGGLQLFARGILCNFLLCLAVWCSFRLKNAVGILLMIWWCSLAFFTCGFEHSVTNMMLLAAAMMKPCGEALTMSGYWFDLLIVSLGNMAGGIIFVGLSYGYTAGAFEGKKTDHSPVTEKV